MSIGRRRFDYTSYYEGEKPGEVVTGNRLCIERLVFTCLLFLLVTGCRVSQQPTLPDSYPSALTSKLDQVIPQWMCSLEVPGVGIALIVDREIVWTQAYGYADLENQQEVTTDSIFRVESISKSLTAWGIMHLVEQGLLDLDKPVHTYLTGWTFPEAIIPTQQVTVRRLLSHNAGLTLGTIGNEYAPEDNIPSLEDDLSQETSFYAEPGSGFSYTNTGYNLLELIIEQASGQDFSDFMLEEVLKPLSMHSATFEWSEALRHQMTTGYDLKGNPVQVYMYPAKASGGLFATVNDIAQFVTAGMRGNYYQNTGVLSQESLRKIQSPQVPIAGIYAVVADDYGFGHFIESLPGNQKAAWHGGQGHGWMSHFHIIPETGDGIVILTNSQRSWPLIARILSEWSTWRGIGAVKMSRITYANYVLEIFTLLIFALSGYLLFGWARNLSSRKVKLEPFARQSIGARIFQAVSGGGILAGLLWSAVSAIPDDNRHLSCH